MSRSFRKSPFIGAGSRSDKKDKRLANRRLRRITKDKLSAPTFSEDDPLPVVREVSNPWDFAKDGKMRIKNPTSVGKKWMRK